MFLVLPSGPQSVTTALQNRPSVVDPRVVLDDIFRGRHDRSEFFGCPLPGEGWEGHRVGRVGLSAGLAPRDEREVLEKDSGQVGWCSSAASTLVKWLWDAEPDGGGVGSRETLQRADEQVPRSGDGRTLPWPGPGSALVGVVLAVRWGDWKAPD